jgi:2-succinyl-5-enolpyruvyl-6-hydroxy-3-cyclohexene-1-carboxylate synthase
VNPAVAMATVLVDELVRGGVQDAVLAPGSRSTPLALALARAEESQHLRLHIRIDERSAGFFALGLAKVSRRPVVVVTTSGTAAVNLHPAVVEADLGGVPLLAVTADRPPELRDTGANQTIDQLKLYGNVVRQFVELGAPDTRTGQNAYWRSVVCRALMHAQGTQTRQPGPVHLNVAFREPLVGDTEGDWSEDLSGRPSGQPWTRAEAVGAPRSQLGLAPRTLVVVGDCLPADGHEALRLAEEQGWPVVSEPSGNASSGPLAISTGGWLLGDPAWWEEALPDSILVVGRPTLSRSVASALRDERVDVAVVPSAGRWADTARRATTFLRALPEADGHHAPDQQWLDLWQRAEQSARQAVDQVLDEVADSEQHIVRALHTSLPSDALLVVGSSLPVRHLFLCARAREGVTTIANRGAAGIDGTTSTALGAAVAWQRSGGGRAVALMGDLTFLHDSNGLLRGNEPAPDLTLVVLNNDGGGIFELLEPADSGGRATFERVFGTPQGADLAALCGASRTPFTRVSTATELVDAVLDPRAGLQVVEVRADRQATADVHRRLADAVSSAVGSS